MCIPLRSVSPKKICSKYLFNNTIFVWCLWRMANVSFPVAVCSVEYWMRECLNKARSRTMTFQHLLSLYRFVNTFELLAFACCVIFNTHINFISFYFSLFLCFNTFSHHSSFIVLYVSHQYQKPIYQSCHVLCSLLASESQHTSDIIISINTHKH